MTPLGKAKAARDQQRKASDAKRAKKRRPIKTPHYVWCDFHCEVHGASPDYYTEGVDDCKPVNWRPVYVLGNPGEEF